MKIKATLFTLALLLVGNNLFSQIITFRHVFGGTGDDFGQDIEQTSDGGYIITGATGSFGYGQSDVYLLKIDSLGIYEWSRSYGGSNIDWGYDVEITSDGGYVIAGYTNSFGAGGYDFYLIRTDSIGDTLWTKTYGGWDWEHCYSMDITSDNGYVMVGSTYSYGAGEKDVWIVKTDEFGDTLWTKTFGGILDDEAKSIKETFDGDLIVCGGSYTFSDGDSDGLLIRLDSVGNTLWFANYGGPKYAEFNEAVQLDDTSGFALFGTNATGATGGTDMYAIKIDNIGTITWVKLLGNSLDDWGMGVDNLPNNRLVFIGSNSIDGGSIESHVFYANGIQINSIAMAGTKKDEGRAIKLCDDAGFVILGNTKSFNFGYSDIIVAKTNQILETDTNLYIEILDTNTIQYPIPYTSTTEIKKEERSILLFPNPVSNNQFTIKANYIINDVQVFDLLGQPIPISIQKSETAFTILPSSIISGIYFVEIRTNTKIISKKVIFE